MRLAAIISVCLVLFPLGVPFAAKPVFRDRRGHYYFDCVRGIRRGRVEIAFHRDGYRVKIRGVQYNVATPKGYVSSIKSGVARREWAMRIAERACGEKR
jgi:hypothetical protein